MQANSERGEQHNVKTCCIDNEQDFLMNIMLRMSTEGMFVLLKKEIFNMTMCVHRHWN